MQIDGCDRYRFNSNNCLLPDDCISSVNWSTETFLFLNSAGSKIKNGDSEVRKHSEVWFLIVFGQISSRPHVQPGRVTPLDGPKCLKNSGLAIIEICPDWFPLFFRSHPPSIKQHGVMHLTWRMGSQLVSVVRITPGLYSPWMSIWKGNNEQPYLDLLTMVFNNWNCLGWSSRIHTCLIRI